MSRLMQLAPRIGKAYEEAEAAGDVIPEYHPRRAPADEPPVEPHLPTIEESLTFVRKVREDKN